MITKKLFGVLVAIFIIALGPNAIAADNSGLEPLTGFDWNLAGKIAVQTGGRIKPLDTFSRDMVAEICGQPDYLGENPVETYFRWMSDGDRWADEKIIYIPKGDLHTKLGLDKEQGNYFAVSELQGNSNLKDMANEIMSIQQANKKLNFTQGKCAELLNRIGMLSGVFSHEGPLFIPNTDGEEHATWQSMPQAMASLDDSSQVDKSSDPSQMLALAFAGLYNSVRDNRPEIFNSAADLFVTTQKEMLSNQPTVLSRLNWEYLYNRVSPFSRARILLLGGFVLYLISLRKKFAKVQYAAMGVLVLGFLTYTSGMVFRAVIGARAPWSDMYESLLAIGWALLLIATIYELIKRERYYGMVASLLSSAVLGVAQFASLDRGINPLVPALQSYWLNYHVIITLSGYASFALAMGLGHAVLIAAIKNRGKVTPSVTKLASANLRIVQIGSMLLVTGILLGAVWANSSWGRFWGWDPKETWALICWFVYIALLHGRSAGWLTWKGFAAFSVGAFPVVIMTYYGVNFYLSGLHSYGAGSSPGIPWQLFAYLGLEGGFLFWALTTLRKLTPRGDDGSHKPPVKSPASRPMLERTEASS